MMTSSRCDHGHAVVRALLVFLCAAGAAVPASAQSPVVSSVNLGMGPVASDLVACGPDALAANPATLARRCRAPVRIMVLPTLALDAADNGAGGEVWRNRRALLDAIDQGTFADAFDPAVRERILGQIPADGYVHRTRVHLPVAQAGFGAHSAMSLTFTGVQEGRISRDLAELALLGYEDGRSDYRFADTEQWGLGYWTLAFGHGRSLPGLDVGVTARVISGTFLTRWRAFDPEVSVIDQEVRGQMIGAFAGEKLFSSDLINFRPPDGLGWGLDVGVARGMGPFRVGVAVQNMLHSMTWSDDTNLRVFTLTGRLDGLDFDSDDGAYDPETASEAERAAVEGLREDAYFPRRLRASAAFRALPMLTLGAGAAFNLGDGDLDRDWDRRYSVGAVLEPFRLLSVQAGVSTDLDGAQELSGGIELGLGRTRLGAGAVRVADADDMNGWRVAFGLSRR